MGKRRRKFAIGRRVHANALGMIVALLGLVAAILLPAAHATIGFDDDDDAPSVASASSPASCLPSYGEHSAPRVPDVLDPSPAPSHPYHDESNCPICRLILACQHSIPPMPAIAPAPLALVKRIERLPEPASFVPQETDAPRSSRGPPISG